MTGASGTSRLARSAFVTSSLLALATLAGAQPPAPPRLESVPERPAEALTGSAFARQTAALSGRERQRRAVAELVSGNLPSHLRALEPVELAAGDAGPRATLWVTPDYLAIGSDEDFLRIPLTYPSAVAVARRFAMMLPTRKIVDAIWAQADVQLEPRPMKPGPSMRSTAYYLDHHRAIEAELGPPAGRGLVAGHKKDVVITRRLIGSLGRIAIYGWHRRGGRAIQPLSLVHGARYADYSHGVRLVYPRASIEGEMRPLLELLADPRWGPLLSYEGTIPGAARLLDPDAIAAASP